MTIQRRHDFTPEQKQARQKEKAELLASLTEENRRLLTLLANIPLEKWSLGELQAGMRLIAYDEAHPDRFKGDGKKALKELYGEV